MGSAAQAQTGMRTQDSSADCWSYTDSIKIGVQLVIANLTICNACDMVVLMGVDMKYHCLSQQNDNLW